MSKFKRGEVTIRDNLYGDVVHPAWVKGGLAAYRSGRGWQIAIVISECDVWHKLASPTLTEAKRRIDALLEMPVGWGLPWDEMRHHVQANATAIRALECLKS